MQINRTCFFLLPALMPFYCGRALADQVSTSTNDKNIYFANGATAKDGLNDTGAPADKVKSLIDQGWVQEKSAQYKAALTSYSDSCKEYQDELSLHPESVNAYKNIATALLSIGKLQAKLSRYEASQESYKSALATCTEGLTRVPGDLGINKCKGAVLVAQGRLDCFWQTKSVPVWREWQPNSLPLASLNF